MSKSIKPGDRVKVEFEAVYNPGGISPSDEEALTARVADDRTGWAHNRTNVVIKSLEPDQPDFKIGDIVRYKANPKYAYILEADGVRFLSTPATDGRRGRAQAYGPKGIGWYTHKSHELVASLG